MSTPFKIRNIAASDASPIVELSHQLGYDIDETTIEAQIEAILSSEYNVAFVATIDNEVVGYTHGFIVPRLTSDPFWEIGALVVSDQHHRKGIASALVRKVEEQASNDQNVRVRCNVKRSEAHRFYEQLGYSTVKEQKVFQQ